MEVGWWALIISGASLLLSLGTFWRNRTPTPRWVTSVRIEGDSDGRKRVIGTVANRGRGVARDVRFDRHDSGLMGAFTRRTAETFGFGEEMKITLIFDGDAHGDGAFVLTWCQEPNLHKVRTKRMLFHL